MATAYLNALATVTQDREETISEYMHRVRLLVLKAHPNLEHSARERILIMSLMLALHDTQLAASLAVVKVQTDAKAERLAAEGKAVRRDLKSRKSSGNYFLPSTSREPENENEKDLNLSEEEKEELMATLADLHARRGNSTERRAGRREATRSTKCYSCGQSGHYRSDCPQQRKSRYTGRQATRPSVIECRLGAGNHYVRECPQLETAKRLLSQESGSKSDSKPTLA